jgi:DNA-binding NtrC family response regulator
MEPEPNVSTSGRLNHILVVDDQSNICQMIHDMLVRRGYAVSTANDYGAAETLLAAHEFGVVISDICFDDDENDGISLLERAQKLQPDTPVILITGVPSVRTASQAVKLNAYE